MLLLDEPLSAVDVEAREELQDVLRRVSADGGLDGCCTSRTTARRPSLWPTSAPSSSTAGSGRPAGRRTCCDGRPTRPWRASWALATCCPRRATPATRASRTLKPALCLHTRDPLPAVAVSPGRPPRRRGGLAGRAARLDLCQQTARDRRAPRPSGRARAGRHRGADARWRRLSPRGAPIALGLKVGCRGRHHGRPRVGARYPGSVTLRLRNAVAGKRSETSRSRRRRCEGGGDGAERDATSSPAR